MSIGEYNKEDLGVLSFGFEVSGDYKSITEVRLILSGQKGSFLVEGKMADGDKEVSFDLANLREHIPSGDYKVKMEVILDENRYIQPLTESIKIKQTPKVEARAKETLPSAKPAPSISVSTPKISMKTPKEVWTESQEKLGYKVVEIGSKLVALKGKTKVAEYE
jgi:hypothetical protein